MYFPKRKRLIIPHFSNFYFQSLRSKRLIWSTQSTSSHRNIWNNFKLEHLKAHSEMHFSIFQSHNVHGITSVLHFSFHDIPLAHGLWQLRNEEWESNISSMKIIHFSSARKAASFIIINVLIGISVDQNSHKFYFQFLPSTQFWNVNIIKTHPYKCWYLPRHRATTNSFHL